MSRELLFWILMLFWLIFGLWADYIPGQPYPFRHGVRSLLLFALFIVLGWQVFGGPVK